MTRHLPLEGVDNFRDFGDYALADGRRLRKGVLYRSAGHSRATARDLEVLSGLNIAVVVDLRSQEEREREPSRRPADFTGRVIENNHHATDGWREHIASSELTEHSFRSYLTDYYRQAPLNVRHIDLFSRYFQALAETEGPVLIHCAAGKDRTGILAALTHHVAGVHPDDMIADYLLTNNPERMAQRLPLMVEHIQELAGRRPDDAAVLTVMGVEPAYLHTAFATMDQQFGGADSYLEKALGVTPAMRETIAARLIA